MKRQAVMELEEAQQPNEEEIEAVLNEVVNLEEASPQTRAKRTRQRPKWLTGYVTPKMKPTKK
jgi:Spy/CpxP family protein refolding chaperone